MTPLEVLNLANEHLCNAIEACEAAAASLPKGSKAEECSRELGEVNRWLFHLSRKGSIELTGEQLLAAGRVVIPAFVSDQSSRMASYYPDQLENQCTIEWLERSDEDGGAGVYCYLTEEPDGNAVRLPDL